MTPITREHLYGTTGLYFCPQKRRLVAHVWHDSKRPGHYNCCSYCNVLQRDDDSDVDTPAPYRPEVEP